MLGDVEAQEVVRVSVDLFFSNNVHRIEELVERVFAEGDLHRFPEVPKSFEKSLRTRIVVALLEETARWN